MSCSLNLRFLRGILAEHSDHQLEQHSCRHLVEHFSRHFEQHSGRHQEQHSVEHFEPHSAEHLRELGGNCTRLAAIPKSCGSWFKRRKSSSLCLPEGKTEQEN